MAELQVSIVSAAHEVWSGAARQIIARTTEGEIGILAGHEPFLAVLAARADDGFISVEHDRVTIVSRVAELT